MRAVLAIIYLYIKMSQENEENRIEAEFKPMLSLFSLRFKDPEFEQKYSYYNAYGKRTPKWFIILIWILVIVLVFRRITIVIYSYFDIVMKVEKSDEEFVGLLVFVASIVFEVIIFVTKRFVFAKGFLFLVALFFLITYGSNIYLSDAPSLAIT